jgi:acetate kinase
MTTTVLTLNAGSSSLKFSVIAEAGGTRLKVLLRGEVAGLGGDARLRVEDGAGAVLREKSLAGVARTDPHAAALDLVLDVVGTEMGGQRLAAAGHRVVHGGDRYTRPVPIDAAVVEALRELTPLAPLHQPSALAAIEALGRRDAALPQVACFDTAFHQTQTDTARRFGIPRALHDSGVKRYGFHGLSYEYVARALPATLGATADGRVIVAHLGSGASLCALRGGRSVATTMGFTPLDGLMMGTRCGALDPGVVLHLLRDGTRTVDEVEHMLYFESGLLGVSGITADMRELLASADSRARAAVDLYCERVAREIGAMAAALSGVDALVFTGGVGENASVLRERICRACEWLGVRVDAIANAAGRTCITNGASAVSAWVIPTREDEMIARHTLSIACR